MMPIRKKDLRSRLGIHQMRDFYLLRFKSFTKFGSNFQEVGSMVYSLLYQGDKPDDVAKENPTLFTLAAPFAVRTTELMLSKRAPKKIDIEYEVDENDPPIDQFSRSLRFGVQINKKKEQRKKKTLRQTRRREKASESKKNRERTNAKARMQNSEESSI